MSSYLLDTTLGFQTSVLQSGRSRSQMFLDFFGSEEFRLGARMVAGAYLGLLKRLPEYGGWLFQRNALASRLVTSDSLIENFLGSEEYRLLFGAPTAEEFVRLLYL